MEGSTKEFLFVSQKTAQRKWFNKGFLLTAPFVLFLVIWAFVLAVPLGTHETVLGFVILKSIFTFIVILATFRYRLTAAAVQIYGDVLTAIVSGTTYALDLSEVECVRIRTARSTGFTSIKFISAEERVTPNVCKFYVWCIPGNWDSLDELLSELRKHCEFV